MNLQGNSAAILVKTSTGFDRQSGKFVQKMWRGTEDAISSVEATLVGADHYTKDPEGSGIWTLTARWSAFTDEGTVETPVQEERLRFNIIQKSLYAHPSFASLTNDQLAAVRKAVNETTEGASFTVPLQQSLYDLLISGIENFNVYQPVVVVTDTASADYPWNIGFQDYGTIFTTAAMIADADLGSGWAGNLPASGAGPGGLTYGWLKKPPEIVTTGGNKSQLVQEYEFGLWSDTLY